MITQEIIGQRLKRARLDIGMTQVQVAEQLYIHSSALCMWEHGKRSPSIQDLSALCAIYHISVDSILTEENN